MLDSLTLDQMRVLIAVADTGSFSAAARRLGRVQSAISQSVQAMETSLGTPLFERTGRVPRLNAAGHAILADARNLIRGAEALKARAASIAEGVEAELTLAVDAMFPVDVLTTSLEAFTEIFPSLPVTVFTEAIGGAEQRLREGAASLGLFVPFPGISDDRETEFLVSVPLLPVVAASHPLAAIEGSLSRAVLEKEVQLVLTDRTPLSNGISGGIISLRTWRFADLSTRLAFLLAGFGWCNMPLHLVRDAITDGRLKVLDLEGRPRHSADIHVVHERGRVIGKAGRWLVEDLRERVKACGEAMPLDFSIGPTVPATLGPSR